MKTTLLITLVFFVSTSFSQDIKKYKMSFDDLIEIDSSKYVLIPVKWEDNATTNDIKVLGNHNYRNIIFYNPETDDHRKLFNDSIQIITGLKSYPTYYREKEEWPICINNEYILFTVRNHNYNEDNSLGNKDPLYLYYCKNDGTNVTQLTPMNYHVIDYKYIKTTNVILVTLVEDSNKDKTFNNKDKQVIYKVDLNDLSKSKIVFELKIK